jgi:hypothetical protein
MMTPAFAKAGIGCKKRAVKKPKTDKTDVYGLWTFPGSAEATAAFSPPPQHQPFATGLRPPLACLPPHTHNTHTRARALLCKRRKDRKGGLQGGDGRPPAQMFGINKKDEKRGQCLLLWHLAFFVMTTTKQHTNDKAHCHHRREVYQHSHLLLHITAPRPNCDAKTKSSSYKAFANVNRLLGCPHASLYAMQGSPSSPSRHCDSCTGPRA